MTEEQAATQADAEALSQADNESTNDSQAEQSISLDEAKKLRSEASNLRKRLKDAETRAQAAEGAGRSEEEKTKAAQKALEDRATAAEQKLQLSNARSEVTELAVKANAVSIKAVFALIRDDIEYDDDGDPTNVKELLAAARKDEPTLFRSSGGSGDGARTGPTGIENDMNARLRSAAGRGR